MSPTVKPGTGFFYLMHMLLKTRGDVNQAYGLISTRNPRTETFEWTQIKDLSEQVLSAGTIIGRVKASIGAMEAGDSTAAGPLTALRTLAAGFFASLQHISLLDWMMANGVRRAPVNQFFAITTQSAVGAVIAEAAWKPCTKLEFDRDSLPPLKAAAQCIMSNDLVRFMAPAGAQLINTEISTAMAAAADGTLLTALLDGVGAISSTGDPVVDIRAAFGSVPLSQRSRPFIATSPNALKQMSLMHGPSGPLFPDLTFTGGNLSGVPAVAVDVLANTDDGDLLLVGDLDQLAGDAQDLDIRISKEGSIAMVDSATGAQQLVSLFQSDSTALQIERYFGMKKVRNDCVQAVNHVNYEVGSPA